MESSIEMQRTQQQLTAFSKPPAGELAFCASMVQFGGQYRYLSRDSMDSNSGERIRAADGLRLSAEK
jgi:hypothetical protein